MQLKLKIGILILVLAVLTGCTQSDTQTTSTNETGSSQNSISQTNTNTASSETAATVDSAIEPSKYSCTSEIATPGTICLNADLVKRYCTITGNISCPSTEGNRRNVGSDGSCMTIIGDEFSFDISFGAQNGMLSKSTLAQFNEDMEYEKTTQRTVVPISDLGQAAFAEYINTSNAVGSNRENIDDFAYDIVVLLKNGYVYEYHDSHGKTNVTSNQNAGTVNYQNTPASSYCTLDQAKSLISELISAYD
ncbi:MAG: hypothetical protein Q7S92_02235 [Candidatus Diapherotrites archaeon]|nr:hypothetical protein [Candidatus Diapherotrites archaeon]